MRLYLSSFRLGDRVDLLQGMIGPGGRVGVIPNAADLIPDDAREAYYRTVYDPIAALRDLEFDARRLDLRDFFGNSEALKAELEKLDLVWACGGNAFVLRRAMRQSGFDVLIQEFLVADRIVYGGDSAGACVACPDLRGIDLMDDPATVPEGYEPDVVWEGLNFIPFHLVPHYDSDSAESEAASNVTTWMLDQALPYRTMRDGDVLICDASGIRAYESVVP